MSELRGIPVIVSPWLPTADELARREAADQWWRVKFHVAIIWGVGTVWTDFLYFSQTGKRLLEIREEDAE